MPLNYRFVSLELNPLLLPTYIAIKNPLKPRLLLSHSRSSDPILQWYRATASETLAKRTISNPWKHFQMTSFSNFQLRNCINLNGKRVYPDLLLLGPRVGKRSLKIQIPNSESAWGTRTNANKQLQNIYTDTRHAVIQKNNTNSSKIKIESHKNNRIHSAAEHYLSSGMTLTPPGALAGHATQPKQVQIESGIPSRNNRSTA